MRCQQIVKVYWRFYIEVRLHVSQAVGSSSKLPNSLCLVRFWLPSYFDKYGILVFVRVSGTLTGTFKYRYRSVFSVPTALVVRLYA